MDRGDNHGPVTQLEFTQAMRDFKTMFPDMDIEVIESVLRSNNGAVDVTIDHLLAMSVDLETEKNQLTSQSHAPEDKPPSYSPVTPPPSYNQAVPSNSSSSPLKLGRLKLNCKKKASRSFFDQSEPTIESPKRNFLRSHSESSASKNRWNPPLVGSLPRNFLRFEPDIVPIIIQNNSESNPKLSSAILQKRMDEIERKRRMCKELDDHETCQVLEDERIAIFLQNEEFVRELRENKDFMTTLRMESQRSDDQGDNTASSTSHHDDVCFREKLKNMSKNSRRKFTQIARHFSRRNKKGLQRLIVGSNSASAADGASTLENDRYSQLENEPSDTESVKSREFDGFSSDFTRSDQSSGFRKFT